MAHSAALARARAGIERHDWHEARRSFQDAAASAMLGADDIESLAWAYAWTGDLERGIQTWEQARREKARAQGVSPLHRGALWAGRGIRAEATSARP